MSTSKAQSIVSSRKSSRRSSQRGSFDEEDLGVPIQIDPLTKAKCVQTRNKKEEDNDAIEKDPSPFAAEQTQISKGELKSILKERKGSF
jgi:hypothetical protein